MLGIRPVSAHIIGGGFAGLAAAALLSRNAGMSGNDITIYEADEQLGGGFFLGGSAESGYNLPGSVFDKEFRCTFELLKSIPSATNPAIPSTKEFSRFIPAKPYHAKANFFTRAGAFVLGPVFGLSLGDGLSLARVLLTPEAMLDGRRIVESRMPLSRWVTFTVTDRGTEFIEQISALTGSEPGRGGLVTLKDSGWVLSLSVFHQPEIIGQPPGTSVWWGYGLYPERNGDFVRKRMDQCTGAEILEETLRHLRFDRHLAAIMASSICVPCNMPYVNNIWLPRIRSDRPPAVPEGATNLGLIGQYVEVPREIAFTIECSVRSAWEAIYVLLKRGPAPPPVYQSQYDPKALFNALKVFVCQ